MTLIAQTGPATGKAGPSPRMPSDVTPEVSIFHNFAKAAAGFVALLQNTQTRADQATQDKLNAIADGLADLMKPAARNDSMLHQDLMELRAAVGLEDRESA